MMVFCLDISGVKETALKESGIIVTFIQSKLSLALNIASVRTMSLTLLLTSFITTRGAPSILMGLARNSLTLYLSSKCLGNCISTATNPSLASVSRRGGSPQHCRIRSKQVRDQTKYYLTENMLFDSLYSLILHYTKEPLCSQNFRQRLTTPVPQPLSHEGKEWVLWGALQKHSQAHKSKSSWNVWMRYFVWNFKGIWNLTQNMWLIHWKMFILFKYHILTALRLKSSNIF